MVKGSKARPRVPTEKEAKSSTKKAIAQSKRESDARAGARRTGRDSAEHHRKTRAARAHEIAHDYVEVIADLTEEIGEARAIDISRRLGVTHVTVNRTVARLQRLGLVIAERYRSIFLTPEGKALAQQVRRRHRTVLEFLRALGVPENVARTDAEGIEHHVSEETLRAFERFSKSGRRK